MPPTRAGIRPTESIPISQYVTSSLALPFGRLVSGHLHRADRPGLDRQFLKWADRPTEAFTATSTAVPSRGQSLTHGLDQIEDVGTSFLRLVPLGEVLQRLDHPLVAEVHQLLDRQQVWMR